jgi:hypothetical protein
MKEYKLETDIEAIQNGYEKTINETFYSLVPSTDEFRLRELYIQIENTFIKLVKSLKQEGVCSQEITLPSILLRRKTKKRIIQDQKGHLGVEELLSRTSTYYCPPVLKEEIVDMLNLLTIQYNCYVKVQYDKECYEHIDDTKGENNNPHSIKVTVYDEKNYLKLLQEELIRFKNKYDRMIYDFQKGYSSISYSGIIKESYMLLNEIRQQFKSLPCVDSKIEEVGFKLNDERKILVLTKIK